MFPASRWNTKPLKVIYMLVSIAALIIILKPRRSDVSSKSFILENARELFNPSADIDYEHLAIVRDYYEKRKMLNISYSNLGRIMFLQENPPPQKSKRFKILLYKIGPRWEERHMYYFGGTKHAPLEFCAVKNCYLSYNESDFADADAVVFHLHVFNKNYNTPTNLTRPAHQRWVFSTDESPHHTFMMQPNDWFNYTGVFNWSMIYRLEADVPIPCGRVLPQPNRLQLPDYYDFKEKFEALVPYANEKRRDVLVAIMSSNCWANKRMNYVIDLQKHIAVDVYGGCASEEMKAKCPFKGYGTECDELRKYMFYLAYENSNCNGYITEKLYSHALKLGSVPILMGMYQNQSELLVPPNSFLHVDNFKNPEDLAKFILHINATFEENYLKYHEWRRDFYTVSEDGYMGARSYHYCRLCEALNYNDPSPKVYYKEDLATLLDPERNCHSALNW